MQTVSNGRTTADEDHSLDLIAKTFPLKEIDQLGATERLVLGTVIQLQGSDRTWQNETKTYTSAIAYQLRSNGLSARQVEDTLEQLRAKDFLCDVDPDRSEMPLLKWAGIWRIPGREGA